MLIALGSCRIVCLLCFALLSFLLVGKGTLPFGELNSWDQRFEELSRVGGCATDEKESFGLPEEDRRTQESISHIVT